MSDELNPCPFCGAPGYLVKGNTAGFRVKCTNTECTAQSQLTEVSRDAVQRWNRRAAPAAVEPAIAPDSAPLAAEIGRVLKENTGVPGRLQIVRALTNCLDYISRPATTPTAEQPLELRAAIAWAMAMKTHAGMPIGHLNTLIAAAQQRPSTTTTAEEVVSFTAKLRSRAWEDRQHRKLREEAADLIERLASAQQELREQLWSAELQIITVMDERDAALAAAQQELRDDQLRKAATIARLLASQQEQVPRIATKEMITAGIGHGYAIMEMWTAMYDAWDASQRGAEK